MLKIFPAYRFALIVLAFGGFLFCTDSHLLKNVFQPNSYI
jgi:hypothetical protein